MSQIVAVTELTKNTKTLKYGEWKTITVQEKNIIKHKKAIF